MKFSIIVPVYNEKKYLTRCLDSILRQSFKDEFQLIIIDDGSDEETKKIIDKYCDIKNVKIIQKKHEGASSARNIGLKFAIGEYILFIDSDDFINFRALEIININLKKYHNCDSLIFQSDLINSSINSKEKLFKRTTFKCGYYEISDKLKFFTEIMPIHGNFGFEACFRVFKNDVIKKNNIYFCENIIYGEDLCFTMSYYSCINNILVIKESLYYYEQNSANSCTHSIKKPNSFYNILLVLKEFYDFCNLNRITNLTNSYYLIFASFLEKPIYEISIQEMHKTLKIINKDANKQFLLQYMSEVLKKCKLKNRYSNVYKYFVSNSNFIKTKSLICLFFIKMFDKCKSINRIK